MPFFPLTSLLLTRATWCWKPSQWLCIQVEGLNSSLLNSFFKTNASFCWVRREPFFEWPLLLKCGYKRRKLLKLLCVPPLQTSISKAVRSGKSVFTFSGYFLSPLTNCVCSAPLDCPMTNALTLRAENLCMIPIAQVSAATSNYNGVKMLNFWGSL